MAGEAGLPHQADLPARLRPPHLNAIERLWGVMHREVTHNRFYANFDLFTKAIDHFFKQRLPREWTTWRDTIADNFRIISHRDFRVLG